MYKDKPYNYGGVARHRQWWMRKRVIAGVMFLFIILIYLLRINYQARRLPPRHKQNTGILGLLSQGGRRKADWDARREKVKEAFTLSWDAYARHAWGKAAGQLVQFWLLFAVIDRSVGYDEFHPISRKGRQMVPGGMGWIIVDSLDTLMIMNLTSRLVHARKWISTSLNYEKDHDVSTFETTIRMLGGLLSAHYLSTTFPDMAPLTEDNEGAPGEDLYLEKATDLADRLTGAFTSASGVPYASVNLKSLKGIPSHADGGASSTSEAASLQLEFKYLAHLTGEANYWEKAEKVMQVIDDNGVVDGLVPIFMYADTGKFREENIRLGSRGDSYYGEINEPYNPEIERLCL